MAQVTEEMCRRIIEDTERGYSTGLTQWERCQLAWAWLKLNGYEAPNEINIQPRLDLIKRPTQETRTAPVHVAHSIRCAKYPLGEPGAPWREVTCTCGADQGSCEHQTCPAQKDGHHDFRHEVCDCGASRGDTFAPNR